MKDSYPLAIWGRRFVVFLHLKIIIVIIIPLILVMRVIVVIMGEVVAVV
jgi:hypothetical protein